MNQMKKIIAVLLLANMLISAACNLSTGFKKDVSTGISFSYNGFRVKDVLLIDPADKRMTDNKVKLNTQIAIVALGINNYGLKDGKAFPGMMLLVTDKKGTPVLNAPDLFAADKGHPPAYATELRGDIIIARPMVAGETYHVKVRVWDKVKASNELNIEADLVVQ